VCPVSDVCLCSCVCVCYLSCLLLLREVAVSSAGCDSVLHVLMMSKSNLRLEGWGGVTSRRSERARVLFSFTQNSQEGGGREREGGFRRSKKRGVGRRRTA
jgi:hypothetical protein